MNEPEALQERAESVRRMIRSCHKKHIMLAESRCPRDGRLLAAALELPDGYWIWQAGNRLTKRQSRQEIEAPYLTAYDEPDWDEEFLNAVRQAGLEDLPENVRLETEDRAAKLVVTGLDDPIQIFQPPDWRPTSLLDRSWVTCGCHRNFRLNILGLQVVAVRRALGVGRRSLERIPVTPLGRFPFTRPKDPESR
ncbi:hypothetical protein [Nonomuraea sp. CA-141351]|uniref:hypothetical protein n=1 Tax=Nonomuraea sp. CA-141351 TaxID=3239996 RepID=UPI003D8D644D